MATIYRVYHPFDSIVLPCEITLSDEESHHLLKVRRASNEAEIHIFNGTGTIAQGKLIQSTKNSATILLSTQNSYPPVSPSITLVQAFPKGSVMDDIIQKSTELGVQEIIPVLATHSEFQGTQEKINKMQNRWETIAIEACKQSANPWKPIIQHLSTLKTLLNRLQSNSAIKLVASLELPTQSLRSILHSSSQKIILIVGPEGDFSPEEYQLLKQAGFNSFTLGKNILRVETATISAIAGIQALIG